MILKQQRKGTEPPHPRALTPHALSYLVVNDLNQNKEGRNDLPARKDAADDEDLRYSWFLKTSLLPLLLRILVVALCVM